MSRGAFLTLLTLAACRPAPGGPREVVVIPDGATVQVAAESLAAHGVIRSIGWFKVVARVGGYERRLKRGPYEFARGAGAIATLKDLAAGRTMLARLVIPEGWTLAEMAAQVEKDLKVPGSAFLAAARDSALIRAYAESAPSLEGFLQAETYLFSPGVPAREIVRAMAEQFRRSWDSTWDRRAEAQGLSRKDLVTLASIVEGEAVVDSDRPLVAAVYRNRLRIGMPLQADPTVQYAIQQATGERKNRLFIRDYSFRSPYNTYLRAGLPPGPVGAPSRKSIEAALAPAAVPYLYFVAGPEGRHVFTRSYAEHLRAIRRIRGVQ
ncbi:MAG: endolytic transglycosylase MltG [Gemmatimonadales bacterium]|nr:endolytic transglycosylase MltG [Gemmatimonadales bacterium]